MIWIFNHIFGVILNQGLSNGFKLTTQIGRKPEPEA
jgi:hypothetical protein